MLAAADTPDGRFVVMTLCDGHNQAPSAVNLDTGEIVSLADLPDKAPASDKSDQPPCAFAAAPAMAVPSVVAQAIVFLTTSQADLPAIDYVQPGRGLPAPPPPATGPPALV